MPSPQVQLGEFVADCLLLPTSNDNHGFSDTRIGCIARVPPPICSEFFLDRLFSSGCVPSFLWSDPGVLSRVLEMHLECDNSMSSVANEIKSECCDRLSEAGEFTIVGLCGTFS